MPECLPCVKRRFPFSLGTTSYIIPADLLPNAEYLAPLVDDIELVLFESEEISNLPDAETIERLRLVAQAADLTYTVHFPLDVELGSPDPAVRATSVHKVLRAWEITRDLQPAGYPLHLTACPDPATPEAIAAWQQRLDESLSALLEAGLDPASLSAETLGYPFEYVEPLVEKHGLAVCLDVGHMLLGGYDLNACLARWWERISIIHLHGILDGHDHRHLGGLPEGLLDQLMSRLTAPGGEGKIVTLEIFSQEDLLPSLQAFAAY